MAKSRPAAAFQTELADNTELATQVETSLKKALGNRGFTAADDAPYVISIAADRTGGATNLSVGSGQQSNAQVNINIDTGQNKLLGGSTQAPEKIARAYRITLAIYDKATGRYVWRAEITDASPMSIPPPPPDRWWKSWPAPWRNPSAPQ